MRSLPPQASLFTIPCLLFSPFLLFPAICPNGSVSKLCRPFSSRTVDIFRKFPACGIHCPERKQNVIRTVPSLVL